MQTNGKKYTDKILKIAIMGIANSGKTTLFNGLTNANERVGNWHGVTTQKVAAKSLLQKNLQVEFLDLPGSYLEDDYTLEGKIALKELKTCNAILMVTEGVNTLKSIKLLSKFKGLNIPIMLVINMNGELERRGGFVDENKIYARSGLSVIKAECNRKKEVLKIKGFIANVLKNEQRCVDFDAILTNFDYFSSPKPKKELCFLDKILLNPSRCILLCASVWIGVLYLAFGKYGIGSVLAFAFEKLCICAVNQPIEGLLVKIGTNPLILGFVLEGVLNAFVSVVIFLPRLMVMQFFITALDESGFLSRIAFSVNNIFSKVGISGRALFTLLSGYGCTVSAVFASMALEDEKTKNRVIGALPFISCSAKTPVYLYIIGLCAYGLGFWVIPFFFILGFLLALGYCFLRSKIEKCKASELVIEFPPYRVPKIKSLLKALQKFTKEFIIKIGSIIVLLSAFIWLLNNLTPAFEFAYGKSQQSILAFIAGKIAFLFKPIGLNDYKIVTALISGLFAKEGVVSTMILLNVGSLTLLQASALLLYIFIYPPCLNAMATIWAKAGKKNALMVVIVQLLLAYILAFLIYNYKIGLTVIALTCLVFSAKKILNISNLEIKREKICKNLPRKQKSN